jgi:hypothetical protein
LNNRVAAVFSENYLSVSIGLFDPLGKHLRRRRTRQRVSAFQPSCGAGLNDYFFAVCPDFAVEPFDLVWASIFVLDAMFSCRHKRSSSVQ